MNAWRFQGFPSGLGTRIELVPIQAQAPYSPLEVFLSHATADGQHMELVRRQIEALGANVYLAEHDPQPGTLLVDKVHAALQRAALVVVLVTSTSVNSNYVQQEIGAARAYGKLIIPIIDSRIAGRIDLGMLQGAEYLELDLSQPAEGMARITKSLRSLVLAPAPLPPATQPSAIRRPSAQPVAPAHSTFGDADKLVLVGIAVVVALLFLGEGGDAAPAA